jgi:hypothetical protein
MDLKLTGSAEVLQRPDFLTEKTNILTKDAPSNIRTKDCWPAAPATPDVPAECCP